MDMPLQREDVAGLTPEQRAAFQPQGGGGILDQRPIDIHDRDVVVVHQALRQLLQLPARAVPPRIRTPLPRRTCP